MRPRGENVEYDKLADRFYASNRALADAEKRIAALAADLAKSRQLLGVYRTQRDSAEERLRALEANLVEEIEAHEAWKKLAGDKEALNIALEAQLVESTRHRDQNRETAVALQMRVSALEAALSLTRDYIRANGGGWCRDGIGSDEILRWTDILTTAPETTGDTHE